MQEKSKMDGVRDMGGVRLASEEDLSGFNKTYKSKTTQGKINGTYMYMVHVHVL